MKKGMIILGLLVTAIALSDCFQGSEKKGPLTAISLGKALFSDPVLSSDRKISCATCHKPAFAFADTSVVSLGVMGRKGVRNTPSAMNVSLAASFFWDGRAATLEEQALIPIANPNEMNLPVDSAVNRLCNIPFYQNAFRKVYGRKPDAQSMAHALAAFQRSMETNDAPFDDWRMNDNTNAVSESVKRGFALFNGQANCVQCHFGADFSNTEFRNIGLFDNITLKDSGRAAISGDITDLGKFKIGPLRNVALTAPYMHNGMFRTLREVIDYYNDPDKVVPHPVNRDSLLSRPLNLSEQDKTDLENFLRSLTSNQLLKGMD
ncbi:cytochrome-c peroxidase [Pseudobacter ginsenosidimutans]|uniref:Cytochrome c peroxidase n=1 Tax=Pseudobacter ginsenosidimutans TaxID=661488 RepID=A0A4Q7N531_9BACT|nr:cytochrome c peroxidase [Pseudobacter ginsenosidimutans]QEC44656.1 cytochrome-c peroxidase [Pseudobacter ginsenosidimutans]RZS76136.1 cytochrome c peroxidase [Pseudobacter ginsenosidimutans]